MFSKYGLLYSECIKIQTRQPSIRAVSSWFSIQNRRLHLMAYMATSNCMFLILLWLLQSSNYCLNWFAPIYMLRWNIHFKRSEGIVNPHPPKKVVSKSMVHKLVSESLSFQNRIKRCRILILKVTYKSVCHTKWHTNSWFS